MRQASPPKATPARPAGEVDPLTVQDLVSRSDAAYTNAKARSGEARAEREKGLAALKAEMAKMKGAEDIGTQMQRWTEQIATYDARLQAAEALVEQAEASRSRAKEAYKLQVKSLEATSTARKNNEVMRKAQDRYEASLETAQRAALEAAAARAELADDKAVREVISDTELFNLKNAGSHAQHQILAGTPGVSMSQALLQMTVTMKAGQTFDEILEWANEVEGPSGRSYGGVCCCLRIGSPGRKQMIHLAESRWFEPLILVAIIANCMTMAWESPLDPEGTAKAAFIDVCEWLFLGIFTVELVVKMVAYGVLFHKGSYLRDPWCRLDFLIVSLAWLPILLPSLGNFSSLRAFRALRPLRALKRVPGMPVLVQWVLDVLPKMGNVLMLCGFVMLIFAIVGMELFKGALHNRCARAGFEDSSVASSRINASDAVLQSPYDTGVACNVDDPVECSDDPEWTCAYFHSVPEYGIVSFDSVAHAFIPLVQGITFDDWATPMYALMASMGTYVWVYFVLMVLIGGFFVTNLFLAVIFLEHSHSKRHIDEELRAAAIKAAADGNPTEEAALLESGVLLSDGMLPSGVLASSAPSSICACVPSCDCVPGEGNCRRALAAIASSSLINLLTTSLVLVNMVIMCMPYEGMSDEYASTLESASTVITWIFILEMAIKIYAFGCAGYWRDNWNLLDGSIVTMSIVEMVLTAIFAGGGVKLSFLRLFRMLRVLRILRLMRSWRGLYDIITTFGRAIPQMSNIFVLILLTMFMFALMGMQLFGGLYTPANGYSLELSCPGGVCADGLREKPPVHFDYCNSAMVTVFILLTGEWVQAMIPFTEIYGPVVCLFFIPVVLVGKYILFNLLVAVILTEFADRTDDPPTATPLRIGPPGAAAAAAALPPPDASDALEAPDAPEMDREGEPIRIEKPVWPRDYSLLCFETHHPFRSSCRRLVTRQAFENFILVAIVISSICLALDSPRLDPASDLAGVLKKMDLFFTAVFFVEMCLKVTSYGFACGEGTYLSSAWNVVDFTIVLVSLLVLLAEEIQELRGMRVLRVLRVLRPLRLVSRNAGMKLIITSLFRALPGVSNVFGVVLSLQVVFVILGMQLFSGEMASCTDSTIASADECVGLDADGEERLWANPLIGSFDNFGDGMRLLYVMSSGDGWAEPMFITMGVRKAGLSPLRNDNSPYAYFSIAWMCVGSIVAINLFVGVVVDNFSRMQKEENGSAIMTMEQQQWVATVKAMVAKQPTKSFKMPDGGIRRVLYRIVDSRIFDGFITAMIIVNIGVMACDYWRIEDDPAIFAAYTQTMLVFNVVYYGEALLKISAYGLWAYLGDSWCQFDFFLVMMTLLSDLLEDLMAFLPMPPMLLRVLRVFRILRILRLLKGARGLRDLILAMVLSFPSLLNVGSLLALIIYIFAVLGVQLFTFLSQGDIHNSMRSGINDERNFGSIGSAALVLFQCLTNDGWADLMADAMATERNSACVAADGTCGSVAAVPYFISFQVLGSFVFINLVVAVILENFSTLHNTNPNLVSASDLEIFSETWAEYDPDATGFILAVDVPTLLLHVARPLGLKGKSLSQAKRMCMRLTLPQHGGGLVAYHELIKDLVENNYFRSGAMVLDEDNFHVIANAQVPAIQKFEAPPAPALPDGANQRFWADSTDSVAKLQQSSPSVALSLAYASVAEALRMWRSRAASNKRFGVAHRIIGGLKGTTGLPSKDKTSSLGSALGVGSATKAIAKLPPGLDVKGGVARLGWVRCNGQKRWVKIGREYVEVWDDNTANKPTLRFPWTKWGVLSLEYDLKRDEPALRAELGSATDKKGRQVLVLEAYYKDSEPTKADREAHLLGFLEEFKHHMARGSSAVVVDFGETLPTPPPGSPSLGGSPPSTTGAASAPRGKSRAGGAIARAGGRARGKQTRTPTPTADEGPPSGRQHWSALGLGEPGSPQSQGQA